MRSKQNKTVQAKREYTLSAHKFCDYLIVTKFMDFVCQGICSEDDQKRDKWNVEEDEAFEKSVTNLK